MGYAHNRQALRTFAIERITAVELVKERFEVRETQDPEQHLRGSFGIVEEEPLAVAVRFAPALTPAVEGRIWHPTQKVKREKDGSIIISFLAGGRREIVSWILSYGPGAEVLKPSTLREEVAKNIRQMAQRYGAPA